MSLFSVLKTVGKDLSNVGSWIEEGIKVAGPIVTAVDPPLGAIITGIEAVVALIPNHTSITAAQMQAITAAVTTIETIKAGATAAVVAASKPIPVI